MIGLGKECSCLMVGKQSFNLAIDYYTTEIW